MEGSGEAERLLQPQLSMELKSNPESCLLVEIEEACLKKFEGHLFCHRIVNELARKCCPDDENTEDSQLSWEKILGEEKSIASDCLQLLERHNETTFAADCRDHLDTLLALWATKFPGMPMMKEGSLDWKRREWVTSFGFQSSNPITDLRGGGYLALENILYVFTNHPNVTEAMEKYDLLCAASVVNVTQMLVIHLRIPLATSNRERLHHLIDPSNNPVRFRSESPFDFFQGPSRISRYRCVQRSAMRSFAALLEDRTSSPNSIQEFSKLVAIGVELCVSAWAWLLKTRTHPPTLLDFPLVFYSVRVRLVYLLACCPRSIKQLEGWARKVESIMVDPMTGPP